MEGVEIGEPVVLARAGAGGATIGVCMGPGPSEVTCTVLPHGVQVIDVHSSSTKRSWALRGRRPTLPAAVVGRGERMVLACDDNSLISWKYTDTDVNKGVVLETDSASAVKFVLVHPKLDGVVLVTQEGQIRVMSSDLSVELCSASLQLPTGAAPFFAELVAVSDSDSPSFLVVVVCSAVKGKAQHVRMKLQRGGEEDGQVGWSAGKRKGGEVFSRSAEAAVSCCAVHSGSRELSVLWSTGEWVRQGLGLQRGGGGLRAEGEVREMHLKGGGVRAVGLGGDYLLVAGRGEGKGRGKGRGDGLTVSVWDTVYGTMQGKAELGATEEGGMELEGQGVCGAGVSWEQGVVVLALERRVVALAVHHGPMSLDNALGRDPAAPEDAPLPPSLRPVNLAAALAGTEVEDARGASKGEGGQRAGREGVVAAGEAVEALGRAVEEGNLREKAVLERLEAQPNNDAVAQVVCSYVEEVRAEAEAREAAKGQRKRGKGVKGLASQAVVQWVVERGVREETKGGLDGALVALVRAGSVAARREVRLVGYAVEGGNLLLLEALLLHGADVGEADMARALRLVLSTCSKRQMDAFITAHAAQEPNVQVMEYDTLRRHLLDLVLTLPRDHWLLVSALRRLSVKEATRLLRYCHSLLKMFGLAPTAKLPRPKASRIPSLGCVVDWTSALLDAHFAALVLSPDAAPLLKELEAASKAETKLSKEIISLDGLLQHMVHRKPLPVRPIPKYAVDTLLL